MSKDYPWGKGTPAWVRDATANDSDKSFTVPAGKVWRLISVFASMSTTATVGNRTLVVSITDGTNIVYRSNAFGNQAASTTFLYNLFPESISQLTTGVQFQPIPGELLTAGYIIRVSDYAVIDAAADDLTVVLHYVEYDA